MTAKAKCNLYDLETGELSMTFVHDHSVIGARFSANGQQLLTWSRDATVRIWDVETGAETG